MTTFAYIAAAIVLVLSSARLTRLVTQDPWPPMVWVRDRWDERTSESLWNDLLHCHWCFSPWATGVLLLWGWLTDLQTAWWVFNGWMAAAYLAAMVVERDEVE